MFYGTAQSEKRASGTETQKPCWRTQPGKGAALRAGFLALTGGVTLIIESDGSMDPSESMLIGALMAGANFVKESRFIQGGGTEMSAYEIAGREPSRRRARQHLQPHVQHRHSTIDYGGAGKPLLLEEFGYARSFPDQIDASAKWLAALHENEDRGLACLAARN